MFDLAVFSQDALQMQPQGEFVLPAGIKPETFHLPSVIHYTFGGAWSG